MPEYRRVYVEGGTYFITLVTFDRGPIFNNAHTRKILRDSWNNVTQRFPFITDAFCLLPDHLHTIMTLSDGDANYSMRVREINEFLQDFLILKAILILQPMSQEFTNMKQPSGSADFGNTLYWMKMIFIITSIIFITTPSDTDWLKRFLNGRGQVFIAMSEWDFMTWIGVTIIHIQKNPIIMVTCRVG